MVDTQESTIAIAATFTAELLREPLAYWTQELGFRSRIEFAPYNQVFQQLLDPSTLLAKNDDGINVILIRFEDWQKYQGSSGRCGDSSCANHEMIGRNVQNLILALKSAAKRTTRPHLVCLCPASPSVMENASCSASFEQMEELMAAELNDIGGVYLVTTSELATTYPVAQYHDALADEIGHVPFTVTFFTSLATMIARRILALRSNPYKVIVLDCDQTLWKGVCGEDGPDSIEIDLPHKALQEFMVGQHKAGMLLCLCSKNNEEDVFQVFDRHRKMLIRRDHILSWRINWKPKPENVRSLAEELNLGLDSFIFIDDNPVECARVQAECRGVLVLQLPQEADDIPRFLNHVWAFDHLKVTKEDKERTKFYKQNVMRKQFQKETLTFQDFLERLDLKVHISRMSRSQMARVAQLTQRTNQFNFTTIRRSEAEVQELYQSEKLECFIVEVMDRFGNYGLVGVMTLRIGTERVEVDTFLLSCRVLGRGVEHQMLARLGQIAKERGVTRVDVPYVPTEKNQPAFDFLDSVGGKFRKRSGEGSVFSLPARYAASIVYRIASDSSRPAYEKNENTKESPDATGQLISPPLSKIAAELYDVEHILKDIESKRRHSVCSEQEKSYVAPRTPIEEMLAEIWSGLLGLNEVGIYDDFFELGGQSLLATVLMSRVYSTFQVELPLLSIFESPTVAELAELIEQHLVNWLDAEELSEILQGLDGLSNEQLKALLNTEKAKLSEIYKKELS
jgi:FkbH-like protein